MSIWSIIHNAGLKYDYWPTGCDSDFYFQKTFDPDHVEAMEKVIDVAKKISETFDVNEYYDHADLLDGLSTKINELEEQRRRYQEWDKQ